MNEESRRSIGMLGWWWASLGFSTALLYAIHSLLPHALSAIKYDLSLAQWVILIINVIAMAYFEGYRGFQKSFSPKFVKRASAIRQQNNIVRTTLAPFFCMGFFAASRRQMISTYMLTLMIVCFVILFRNLPQPWRGIFDWGVIVGLTWGCIATLILLFCPKAESSINVVEC